MATIIKLKNHPQTYIFLGSGYGMYQSKKPNWFFGDLVTDTEEDERQVLCVCDAEGNIGWIPAESAEVISIDGKSPSEYF